MYSLAPVLLRREPARPALAGSSGPTLGVLNRFRQSIEATLRGVPFCDGVRGVSCEQGDEAEAETSVSATIRS